VGPENLAADRIDTKRAGERRERECVLAGIVKKLERRLRG
jgi:hypothetical protein